MTGIIDSVADFVMPKSDEAPIAAPSDQDAALLAINDLFNGLLWLSPSLTDGWIIELQGYTIAHWDTIGPIITPLLSAGTSDAFKLAFLATINAVAKVGPISAIVVRLVMIVITVKWPKIFAKAQPALAARGVKV